MYFRGTCDVTSVSNGGHIFLNIFISKSFEFDVGINYMELYGKKSHENHIFHIFKAQLTKVSTFIILPFIYMLYDLVLTS